MESKSSGKKRDTNSSNIRRMKVVYGDTIFSVTMDGSKILESKPECILSLRKSEDKKTNKEHYTKRDYLNEETNEIDMLDVVFDKRNSGSNKITDCTCDEKVKDYKREMHMTFSKVIDENLETYPAGVSCHITKQIILDDDFLVEDISEKDIPSIFKVV